AQEKAQKTQEKAAKEKQKNAERLAKAQKNVMSIQTQISKQETEIANETNKFNMNKVKGKLSPNDEVKYKQRILKKEEALNKLNAKLNKAKSDITKYSN
ncbi:MAG: hypothetical protein Q4G08_10690, partial [Capnocytophaga sp.]|nr:hypothetical protein [Capnocytophaga sp.]